MRPVGWYTLLLSRLIGTKGLHMGQRVQGTEDLYGSYMSAWQHMEDVARELFGSYGFDRVETPAIEQVDTFVHGIGESTDVVRKEMFRVISGASSALP